MAKKSHPNDGRRKRGRASAKRRPLPPFPLKQLVILAVCRLSEPIAFMGIFPYIYFMIQDFHITEDEKKISFYAGMVTSAFTFAEFSAGVFWGRLSDKIGRKPVILCGLAGTAVSVLAFGFAPNLQVAVIARALGGLLNGNIGVMQTTVTEIIQTKAHQHRAFTVMPITWCVGSIIGPAIGGALARPCKFYPDIFPPGSIWDRFPYLLPNLFSAAAVLFGFVFGILFLQETHCIKKTERDRGIEFGNKIIAFITRRSVPSEKAKQKQKAILIDDEEQPLLDADDQLPSYSATASRCPPLPMAEPSTYTAGPSSSTAGPSTSAAGSSTYIAIPQEPQEPTEERPRRSSVASRSPPSNIFNKQVIYNIISFGILAFHTMTFDQLLPVFLSTQPPENAEPPSLPFKFAGGFGMDNQTIGMIISVQGFYMLFINAILFPYLSGKLGHPNLFKIIAVIYFLLYLVVPYVVLLPQNLQVVGVVGLVIWKCTFSTLAYPCNALMITESAPHPLVLGMINGAAASAASLCRAFGPTFSGFLYAIGLESGYSGLAWWFSAIVSVIGGFVAMQLQDLSKRKEKEDEDDEDEKYDEEEEEVDTSVPPALLPAAHNVEA